MFKATNNTTNNKNGKKIAIFAAMASAGMAAAAGSEKIGTAPVSGMSAAVTAAAPAAAAETKAAPKAAVKTEETNEMGKFPGEAGCCCRG